MKTDMSGAAAVIAAMSALKDLGVKTKVIGLRAAGREHAERHRDPARRRAEDPQRQDGRGAQHRRRRAASSSPTRSALAAEDKADAIVDLATLTGACVVALGEKIAGLMGNDDGWGAQVRAAADRAGEPVWPLPLPEEYRKMLESEVADLKNIGSGGLRRRAHGRALPEGVRRRRARGSHLDIAGPARAGPTTATS